MKEHGHRGDSPKLLNRRSSRHAGRAGELRRPRLAPGCLLSIGLAVLFFSPMIYLVVSSAQQAPKPHETKATCRDHLNRISVAILSYMRVHDGALPPALESLSEDRYLEDPSYLVCPQDTEPFTGEHGLPVSYAYVGPLASSAGPEVIIAYDGKSGNHTDPPGRHALFHDGHVWFVSAESFPVRLEESLRRVMAVGWSSYSPQRQEEIKAFYTPPGREPLNDTEILVIPFEQYLRTADPAVIDDLPEHLRPSPEETEPIPDDALQEP